MDLQGPRFSSCPFRTRENSWEFRWSIWCTIYRGDADTARRSARIFRHFKRYSSISLSFLRLYKRTLRIDWWRILEMFLFNYSNNSHNSSEWIEIHWKIKIYFSVRIHIRWNNFRLFDSQKHPLTRSRTSRILETVDRIKLSLTRMHLSIWSRCLVRDNRKGDPLFSWSRSVRRGGWRRPVMAPMGIRPRATQRIRPRLFSPSLYVDTRITGFSAWFSPRGHSPLSPTLYTAVIFSSLYLLQHLYRPVWFFHLSMSTLTSTSITITLLQSFCLSISSLYPFQCSMHS